MNDPFRYQYKSQNLARLQDIFVNETSASLRTNYTITNKSVVYSPKSKIEFVNDKQSSNQSLTFIKKYNKVLNEFCIPEGSKYITVDLDEKSRLNYLQHQIDQQRNGAKQSYQSKLNDVKINYLLGSPIKSSRTEINYDIDIKPRPHSPKPYNKNYNDFVLSTNTFTTDKNKSYLNSNNRNSEDRRVRIPSVSKVEFAKKEIYTILNAEEEEKAKPILDRISSLRIGMDPEKALKKKVILTSKQLFL